MSPQARMAAGNASVPDAGITSADAGVGPFVINLTSSTTPMALAHPDAPELKRFSFFVSRRREDNRERFRLHMGYFSTLAEAEEWLNVIRDLYPGAWAGEAPGKKLRARAAAADLARQLPAPPSAPAPRATAPASSVVTVTATAPKAAPPPAARVAAPIPAAAKPEIVVPTLQAAPTFQPAPQPAVAASAAPMLEAVAQAAAALAAVAKTAVAQSSVPAPAATARPAPAMARPAYVPPAAPVARAPAPTVARSAPPPAVAARVAPAQAVSATPASRAPASSPPARAPGSPPQRLAAAAAARLPEQPARPSKKNVMTDGSNVREVMASLDETGETRQMRIPPGLRVPPSVMRTPAPPAAQARVSGGPAGRAPTAAATTPVSSARGSAPAGERPRAAAAPSARVPAVTAPPNASLSDTQVLRMLETRRSEEAEKGNDDANAGISLLKPDDTQTRRALKEAVIDNAPVSFAVQLQWSVQPVELDKVPPLAIFSAYTLYTVEGSREGRKWYGLRLGFFSDAISAKQVAYYVRSEFASVAVVPVSPAEKSRASDEETKSATGAFQKKRLEPRIEEFKLFDDDKAVVTEPPPKAAPAEAPAAAGGKPGAKTAPRKNKPLGKVRAKEQRSPKTLEETLEILGASDLEIDNGSGELLNDTGVRHLRVEVQKNTPFAKLLDRLSERVRKN
jgi:hypothetical protein